MTLAELYEAIRARYEVAGIPLTDLYLVEAPAEAVFPYVVLQLVSGIADDFASGKAFTENRLMQFNLFDDESTMSRLLIAYAALVVAFDFADLGGLSCVRAGTTQTKVDGVWQINQAYRIKVRSV